MESSEQRYLLTKKERLSSVTQIEKLFKEGRSFVLFPFKIYYTPTADTFNKIVVSVPKRKFKKAVDRNTLKRRIKEAYRTNKHIDAVGLNIAIVYLANEKLDFITIKNKLILALQRLNNLQTRSNEKII